jgi:carbonic anhydrase
MDDLIAGFRRFHDTYYRENRDMFDALATKGQRPRAAVIACSDSRVDPQMLFGAGPGELFTIRNVANLVPPYAPDAAYHGTSACLEFAVRGLEVPHIVVLGHTQCGGIQVLMQGADETGQDFVAPWMRIAAPARAEARRQGGNPEQMLRCCEREAIRVSLANLRSFPWIREREDAGRLHLHGGCFDIAAGRLIWLNTATSQFEPL